MRARITEQVDESRAGFVYSWIMDCVPYRGRLAYPGWQWIPGAGCRGCYRTKYATEALAMASLLRVEIGTNGTHAALSAPVTRALASSKGLKPIGA